MDKMLSVIVPVYNVASLLPRCIESLFCQSFTEYELLLVDDGSTDDSGKICEDYAAKDQRTRVFHKTNGGVSSARNFGLAKAGGEWVLFLDADDTLLPGGLQTLVDGISEEVDLVMGGYLEDDGNRVIIDTGVHHSKGIIDRKAAMWMVFSNPFSNLIYMGYAWGKLFRNEIITGKHIVFDEKIKIKEDTLFVVEYLCSITRPVFFSSVPVCHYMRQPQSVISRLSVSYNPDYLSTFDVVVKMNRLIGGWQEVDRPLARRSKEEVMRRLFMIYGHLSMHHAVDGRLFSGMKWRARKEVGTGFYYAYLFDRYKQKTLRFLRKHLQRTGSCVKSCAGMA
ncbi:MAG: glycosyltransferase [Bacteroidales bacterium]|nr:glycosyltransferase [Bacteroidales bacterium]